MSKASGMKHAATVLGLLLCALPVLAQSPVRELKAGEEAGCQPVEQQVCSSTSMKPEDECFSWHSRMAKDAGADAFVVRETERSRKNKPSLTGMKTEVTTKISADYFRCQQPAQVQPLPAAAPAPRGDFSTVEKRLQVLESLKAKGLISADEYQQKRGDILNDL
ncbi:SHOCT domain-containing protein [Thalassolituus sp. LLYu03]|uniref:SHOCT domain-containing protein n=1 Tax=Thalassolituus sp. LLYu03 TaxID=3421656 RepID=UPI003D2C831F